MIDETLKIDFLAPIILGFEVTMQKLGPFHRWLGMVLDLAYYYNSYSEGQ